MGSRVATTTLAVTFLVALVGVPAYFYFSKPRSTTPCDLGVSVPLSNPLDLPDGSIVDDDVTYPPGYHFTWNFTTRGCLCQLQPCLRKCCAPDEYYIKVPGSQSKCVKNPNQSPFEHFSIPVHNAAGEEVKVEKNHFRMLYGDVCDFRKYLLIPEKYPEDKFQLSMDGKIRKLSVSSDLDVSQYCLESRNGSADIHVFLCFQPDHQDDVESKVREVLYPLAMIVSVPFLLVTIVVYSILPELRHTNGMSFVCQCVCLLVAYVGLTIILSQRFLDSFWCVFLAFIVLFSFLGSFFWMNITSFDIWFTLRTGNLSSRMQHKRFLWYSAYAWGVPAAIVATAVAMDMTHGLPDSIIKPGFGKQKCWFMDSMGQILYLYLPTGIVLVLNTLMFISTTFKLRSDVKKTSRDKVRFQLYLKLSIVMGLTWILELVSFFVGGPDYLWFITDLSNALQGVLIFFLFVCRRSILRKLSQKFCPQRSLFKAPSAEYSRDISGSLGQTKTEVDLVALKEIDRGSQLEIKQPQEAEKYLI